uniref:Glutaredoxin-2, mitochondrial n=1 Tax=Sinocyclocheilus grahami TaxID=75366 RepID=A0A672KDT4_SINGR
IAATVEVVSSNCVVIFSKTTCPYCKMAKNVFKEIGAAYKVVELDQHNDGGRLQETLAQMTGARTVPRVFINGQCIGGGTDTKQLHQNGGKRWGMVSYGKRPWSFHRADKGLW